MESFVSLGTHNSFSGGKEDDIETRSVMPVISVLCPGCGCETWRMTQTDKKKLNVSLHKSLQRIFKIYWPIRIRKLRRDKEKIGNAEHKQANGKEEFGVTGSCSLQWIFTHIQKMHSHGSRKAKENVVDCETNNFFIRHSGFSCLTCKLNIGGWPYSLSSASQETLTGSSKLVYN